MGLMLQRLPTAGALPEKVSVHRSHGDGTRMPVVVTVGCGGCSYAQGPPSVVVVDFAIATACHAHKPDGVHPNFALRSFQAVWSTEYTTPHGPVDPHQVLLWGRLGAAV
jgi:hypothetical protein